jgi:hypothetical protein
MGSGQRHIRLNRLNRRNRLGRFVRGRRPDRNPLRRASDRVETAVLALLVVAFLAAAPFTALAGGAWAHARAHQAQLMEEASRHQVPAVVLKVTTGTQDGGVYAAVGTQAQARWRAPDGKVLTQEVPVALGTVAGATVLLWMTSDGQLTDPPLQDSQVTGKAVFAATVSVIVLATFLAIAGMLARRALDKRRMAAWDAEWRATGPRWTTRA